MSLWICRWPNGDATLVQASSKDDAVLILDELGPASAAMLERLPRSRTIYVGFRPCDDPECPDSESDNEHAPHWHFDEEDSPSDDMLEFLGSAKEALAKRRAIRTDAGALVYHVSPPSPEPRTLCGLPARPLATVMALDERTRKLVADDSGVICRDCEQLAAAPPPPNGPPALPA